MRWTASVAIVALLVVLSFTPARAATPTTAATTAPAPHDYLLELCGIAGTKRIDRGVVRGIVAGGFTGDTELYDWTEHDPGMHALLAFARNKRQAKRIAAGLAELIRARPAARIFILSHSGGTGLAVWALEDLPADCKIESLTLMSSALSPSYDLSAALRHVNGHCYTFSSLADLLVLGTGTTWFGTIDGVKTDAAGRVGFTTPATADPAEYKKLVQLPYDPAWSRYGDLGDHIGGMGPLFGQYVLAPLMLHGQMPMVHMATTTETPTGLGRKVGP